MAKPIAEKPVHIVSRRRPKRVDADDSSANAAERYLSKAIGRALDVLDLFPDEHCFLNLKEVSSRMGLPESSLFRILLTLKDRAYLRQDSSGCYCLAPRVLLGKTRERADHLAELVQPTLRHLASLFNETASLAYLFETRIQVLESIDTLHDVRVINQPGRVLPPHCSSLGKAIAAFQERPVADEILAVYGLVRRTPNTLTDRQALLADFEQIRERGYSVDREEACEGGICLAAPIRKPNTRVVAAISVSSAAARMNPQREEEIAAALLETTAKVAALM
jgi:DNA-binding IclR family transcriptional regulator